MGIVLGLGITRLLTGTARFVQHPRRQRPYWLHLAWVLYMLVALTHFWWWEFWLYGVTVWTYEFYVFLIAYTGAARPRGPVHHCHVHREQDLPRLLRNRRLDLSAQLDTAALPHAGLTSGLRYQISGTRR